MTTADAALLRTPLHYGMSDDRGAQIGRSANDCFRMHNYQPAPRLEKNFVPDGCSSPAGDVITFGAGQQFESLYKFAFENKVRIVGGACKSVGVAGGWVTGGGHSVLSNELGTTQRTGK
jgi:hypothetical protein